MPDSPSGDDTTELPSAGIAMAGLDAMPVEAAVLDGDGTILMVNGAWRRFADENHGVHPAYWVGENYLEICERADDALARTAVEGLGAILDGSTDHFRAEYPCHSPDEQRWFVMEAAGFDRDGERYLFVCHVNITDRKLAELRAEARTEQLEVLLGVLTHDIRNPLNVIDGYAALLAEELDDDEELEHIRQAAARITEITEATLSFTRSGALSDVETLSIAELVCEAWKNVTTSAATLVVRDTQKIVGDRRLVLQLFENLFRNAVEHAGEDCTVTVGRLPDGFYVEDDGAGVPEIIRERALEADFSTRGAGGLGLAIVQTVVAAHGGTLRITDAEDGGARFEITGLEIPP